jgi:hypothetical protein
MGPLMRIPSSLKLIAGMWIAALLGALAGRSLAEVSSAPSRGASVPSTDKVGVR